VPVWWGDIAFGVALAPISLISFLFILTLKIILLNAPRSCVHAHVCACTLMFVLFPLQYFVDYSLALDHIGQPYYIH
jgi:hypothetical protein